MASRIVAALLGFGIVAASAIPVLTPAAPYLLTLGTAVAGSSIPSQWMDPITNAVKAIFGRK